MNFDVKATGVIRRIDDLGRIVVTKEVRRQLCIREGDPLELFVGDGVVAFKKYNPTTSIKATVETLRDAVRDEPLIQGKTELLKKLNEFCELLDADAEDRV